MSTQRRIFWFVCIVAVCIIPFILTTPTNAQSIVSEEDSSSPSAQTDYPADPPSEIDWSDSSNSWDGIVASFNNAHIQENSLLGTSLPPIDFPTFESWQALSSGEKTLWLINQERSARGLAPMQGLEENVTGVAQDYAEWMLANNQFGHDADGRSPWDRMYANAAISSCHDFISIGENLQYHASSGPDSVPFVIEKSVYVMMYMDADSEWGHRHAFLWTPYSENSGDPDREGFLGVGHAHGPYTSPSNGRFYQNTDMIVMDFFDPCATWAGTGQATPSPTPSPTSSPTPTETSSPAPVGTQPPPPTPSPSPTPSATASPTPSPTPSATPTSSPTPEVTPTLRQGSRTVSGEVTTPSGGLEDQGMANGLESSNPGLASVTITSDDGQTTLSDEGGEFTLEGLSPGIHTLTPSKEGYVFSPPSIEVDLSADDLGNIKFMGISGPTGFGGLFSLHLPLIRPD